MYIPDSGYVCGLLKTPRSQSASYQLYLKGTSLVFDDYENEIKIQHESNQKDIFI